MVRQSRESAKGSGQRQDGGRSNPEHIPRSLRANTFPASTREKNGVDGFNDVARGRQGTSCVYPRVSYMRGYILYTKVYIYMPARNRAQGETDRVELTTNSRKSLMHTVYETKRIINRPQTLVEWAGGKARDK